MSEATATKYELTRWDLGDLFPGHDSQEMEATLADLEKKVADFEGYRDKL